MDFEFPNAQSGLYESLHIIIKTLNSFLTNKFNFRDRQAESYFYHISTLLKFIIRAIQFKGISLFNDMKKVLPTIRIIYLGIIIELDVVLETNFHIDKAKAAEEAVISAKQKIVDMNALRDAARAAARADATADASAPAKDLNEANAAAHNAVIDATKANEHHMRAEEKVKINEKVKLAAIALIDLFFNEDKTFFSEQTFTETNIYRNTDKKAADERVAMTLHENILNILIQHGFDRYLLDALLGPERQNLFGGVKYSIRNIRNIRNIYKSNQHQRRKYTKKNKKQQNRKTKRNKNKKIKFTLSKKMNPTLKINKKKIDHNK